MYKTEREKARNMCEDSLNSSTTKTIYIIDDREHWTVVIADTRSRLGTRKRRRRSYS